MTNQSLNINIASIISNTPPFYVNILSFCDTNTLASLVQVCKLWRRAVSRKYIWQELCRRKGWSITSSLNDSYFIRTWFLHKNTICTRLSNTPVVKQLLGHPTGIMAIFPIKPSSHYDWSTGTYIHYNENMLVSGSSAPDSHFRVWNSGTCDLMRKFGIHDQWNFNCVDIAEIGIFFARTNAQTQRPHLHFLDFNKSNSNMGLNSSTGITGLTEMVNNCPDGHTSTVTCVKIDSLSYIGISGGYDQKIIVWCLKYGNPLTIININSRIWSFDIENNRYNLNLTDSNQQELVNDSSLDIDNYNLSTLYVLSGSDDRICRFFRLNNPNDSLMNFVGHKGSVMVCKFDQYNNSLIYTAGYDSQIRIWNKFNGVCLSILTGHTGPIFSIEIISHGFALITAGRDRTIRIWDHHKNINEKSINKTNNDCIQIIISKHVSDIKTCVELQTHSPMTSGDFSHTTRIATGSLDGRINIWDFSDIESGRHESILNNEPLSYFGDFVMYMKQFRNYLQ